MWLGLMALAHAVCGDGIVDEGEACDDFNLVTGDGCSEVCEQETFWECSNPPEPFLATVHWSGTTNCGSSPRTDLAGVGVPLSVPDWPLLAMSPTGRNCVSAWSSGDSGRWFYSTRWQAGPASAGIVGSLGSPRTTLAACRAESESQVALIRPRGQTTVHFGMLDNPCYDNRGSVEIEVAAISDCVFVGDPDEDGLLNDVDVCPTVYLQLDAPYEANFACVSELSTWEDAVVETRARVHRDTVVSGSVIGPHAEVHRQARVDASAVVMRRGELGHSSQLGADSVLGPFASLGANVRSSSGVGIESLTVAPFATVGDDVIMGSAVTLGARSRVGSGTTLGNRVVLGRIATLDTAVLLGDDVVLGPDTRVGPGTHIAARTRIRRGARLGAGVEVAEDVVISRDVVVGDGAVIGAGAVLRSGVVVAPGAVVAAGAYVAAGTEVP